MENTLSALQDCHQPLVNTASSDNEEGKLSNSELSAAVNLLELCEQIVSDVKGVLELDEDEPFPNGWSYAFHDANKMMEEVL
jgi:hypothetical protein